MVSMFFDSVLRWYLSPDRRIGHGGFSPTARINLDDWLGVVGMLVRWMELFRLPTGSPVLNQRFLA
jgi:hypothetical protein